MFKDTNQIYVVISFMLLIHIYSLSNRLYLQVCLQVYTKRPQDTKEARVMALLLNHEVLGIPVTLDISHARAKARASADLLKVLQS